MDELLLLLRHVPKDSLIGHIIQRYLDEEPQMLIRFLKDQCRQHNKRSVRKAIGPQAYNLLKTLE